MTQVKKAHAFKAMHSKTHPLTLYNIWDAGSAKTIEASGAKAIATGSWSIAAAQGFDDGEAIPLDFLLRITERIVKTVSLPVTLDFEGGYAVAPEKLAANIHKVIATGIVGINFEDRVIGGGGLHPIALQTERVAAIRQVANAANIPLFINARTDLFLGTDPETHHRLIDQALMREAAYVKAGADGFFIPGLTDPSLIKQITNIASLPVNVMKMGALASRKDLSDLAVSRVSHGPGPYLNAMRDLTSRYTIR